jgi:energy-coupling factor transporter ATP-binding protein EcfA2
MLVHAWRGNRAAARRQFDECVRVLEKELDGEPQESTRGMAEAITQGRPPTPTSFAAGGPRPSDTGEQKGTPPAATEVPESRLATVVAFRAAGDSAGRESRADSIARRAFAVVPQFHGRLIESSNTEVIAVFNDARSLESNHELALRAALEMRDEMSAARATMCTSIATGRLARITGPESPREGRLSGEALSLARLLARRTAENDILVDEHTYRLAREAFSFEVGLVYGSEDHPGYRVVGVASPSRKSREGSDTGMVGRDEELGRLVRAYEKSVGGVGQVVVITGEAGIGKSRLVRALHNIILKAQTAGEIRWLEGRCLVPSSNTAYWPFIDIVQVIRSDLRPHPSEAQAKDSGRDGELVKLLAGRTGKEPQIDLSELADVTLELLRQSRSGPHGHIVSRWRPEEARQAAFRAVALLLRALARKAPLVLVLEDLHFADEPSLELLDSLLDPPQGLPVLTVLVYRVDRDHRSHNLAASAARKRSGEVTEIHLREMGLEECRRILATLVPSGSFSAAAREAVLQKSRGNPYFLEELARAAVSGGHQEDSGLPEGIATAVLTRFYNLAEDERKVLGCAAVIGRVFPKRLLELATERPDLGRVLESLEEHELLYVERSVPEIEFSFNHVLTQEAIYGSLRPEMRRALHQSVATAYKSLSPSDDEYCEPLAYHFDRAGDRLHAVDFYYLSGEKARRGYANTAAVAHFTRGLELLRLSGSDSKAQDRQLDFLVALGVPLVLVRGHQDPNVEKLYLRARTIAQKRGTATQLFHVYLGLSRCQAHSRRCLPYRRRLVKIAQRIGDPCFISRAEFALGEAFLFAGDLQRALQHAEKGSRHSGQCSSPQDLVQFRNDNVAVSLMVRSLALWSLGRSAQAVAVIEEFLARARGLGHPYSVLGMFTSFGVKVPSPT